MVAGCAYFLYTRWQNRPIGVETMRVLIAKIPLCIFGLMILLSLSSWLVESKKWQVLVGGFWELRFRESIFQNLTAQAASFITPLRAGEVVFKVLFYTKSLRKDIAGRVVVGNLVQMVITILLGCIGALYILSREIEASFYVLFLTPLLFLLPIVGTLWMWKRYDLKAIARRVLWLTTGLSFLRYCLFASNWLLILWTLDYEMSMLEIIMNTLAMYLFVSIIPLIPMADVPVRMTAAAMIFEGSYNYGDTIIFATVLVWIINTILPTAIGCALLPFKKFHQEAL